MPERDITQLRLVITQLRRVIRLMLIGYVILTLAIAVGFYMVIDLRRDSIRQLNAINVSQCDALDNLYTSIGKTLTESDKRINELDYYKAHPAERLNAHKANEGIIRRFKRPPCPPHVVIDTGS